MLFTPALTRRLTGVTARQLHYWEDQGIIRPARKTGTGFGARRLYAYDTLVEVAVAKALLDVGLQLHVVPKALTTLRAMRQTGDVRTGMLGLNENGFVEAVEARPGYVMAGVFVAVVALRPIIDRLNGAIEKRVAAEPPKVV